MLIKGLPDPAAGGNADLVAAYANEKNGQRWASVPVAVFFTEDFVELYRYIEYPAIYRKERVLGHLRAARGGETPEAGEGARRRRDRRPARVALLRRVGAGRDRRDPQPPSTSAC